MLGIVKEDSNNNKYIQPLTSDVGAGAPVGTIIAQYKKADPDGYLYLDGSTFDSAQYPALYMYLGTNVLPDYREFALVGAEQNSTDVYDASTNPDGTIHSHDVYTEGEAKDDQLQTHTHKAGMNWSGTGNVRSVKDTSTSINAPSYAIPTGEDDARHGTVTRGKRKAVFFYIKATSGVAENQQDAILNTINTNRSYSTAETPTGKKWIDGKTIYRKVLYKNQGLNSGNTTIDVSGDNLTAIETFVNATIVRKKSASTSPAVLTYSVRYNPSDNTLIAYGSNTTWDGPLYLVLEYTKTS